MLSYIVLTIQKILYMYFGVAVLIGLTTGASLHYLSRFIITALNLDVVTEDMGTTSASYRENKADTATRQSLPRVEFQSSLNNPLRGRYPSSSKQEKAFGNKGLQSTTILEEEDSSDI